MTMIKTRAIAVVLARGGSKGLPRKNALPLAGKPCVAWTLEAAKAAAGVARVILSTDDDELMEIGRRWEVEVIPRTAALANDTATVDAAARATIESMERGSPLGPTTPIVVLYGNVPVRPAGLIDRAVTLLDSSGCDSVQSYQPVGKHHPWWTARVDADGQVAPWEGEVLNHGVFRRQDLPPAFIPDGGVIAVTRAALFLQVPGATPGPHAFFGRDRRGVVNPEGSVVDIDSRMDLLVAEAVLGDTAEPNRERKRPDDSHSPSIPGIDSDAPCAGPAPLAYLITFRTYGTWLHGDARTSVDRRHNVPGTPPIEPDEQLYAEAVRRMKQPPVELSIAAREVAARTMNEVCAHRGWVLRALNVRTNHVHVVVGAADKPEKVMNDLKAWSTRRLKEAGLLSVDRPWSTHGSTRYIWRQSDVQDACRYVTEQQDLPWGEGTR